MRKLILSLVLAVATVSALAETTTRNEEHSRIAAGGWQVIWSRTINEAQMVQAGGVVAATASCMCPEPFQIWFDEQMRDIHMRIRRHFAEASLSMVKDWVTKAVAGNHRLIRYQNFEIQTGKITIQRWQDMCVKIPGGGQVCAGCKRIAGVEFCAKRQNLPNHAQFYIRYRLNGSSTGPGPRPDPILLACNPHGGCKRYCECEHKNCVKLCEGNSGLGTCKTRCAVKMTTCKVSRGCGNSDTDFALTEDYAEYPQSE